MKRLLIRLRTALAEEEGQAVVLVAVSLVALLGFAGLAVDVGQMQVTQRRVQSAADASALAGALEIGKCRNTEDCSAMTAAAQAAVTENGLTNSTLATQCGSTSGDTLSVTINNGPCAMGSTTADANYGNSQYVESVVNLVQPTIFAKVLGIPSLTISARAEATVGNDPYCLYLSGTSGTTLTTNKDSSLSLSCGIMLASNGTPALQANSGSSISATSITEAGTAAAYSGATISPTPSTGVVASSDPLANLPVPSPGSCTYNNTAVSGTVTLSPGTYCGGISTSKGTAVTFQPGLYVVEGGMAMNDDTVASGSGVTIYIYSGSLSFNLGSSEDLVAPTTGTYAGILFYQSTSDTNTATINAGSDSILQGALYFPDAQLQLNGSNNAAYTIVDAQSVTLDSGSTFKIGSDYSSLPGGSPAKALSALLVE